MSISRWNGASVAYAASIAQSLAGLPKGKLLRALQIDFNLTGTKGATDALDGRLYPHWVPRIAVGPYLDVSGFSLMHLEEHNAGRLMQDPTDIPGSGTTFDVNFRLRWEPRQVRQQGANDGGLPTEMLLDHSLELTFNPTVLTGGGTLTVTAGTIRLSAELVDSEPGYNPQIVVIGQRDYATQTFPVEPGVLLAAFLLDQSASAATSITEAEVSNVIFDLDGKPYWSNQTHRQIINAYNAEAVIDTAAELAVNAATRFPLVWLPQKHGQLTKQPAIDVGGQVRLSGTQTTNRLVYAKVVEKDPAVVARIQNLTGGDVTAPYKIASAKGSMIEATQLRKANGAMPRKGRITARALPGKFKPQ